MDVSLYPLKQIHTRDTGFSGSACCQYTVSHSYESHKTTLNACSDSSYSAEQQHRFRLAG